ncbi:MAG: hypothetical protein ACRD2Z_08045, partial [Thermoanaerobaculia bacterium]
PADIAAAPAEPPAATTPPPVGDDREPADIAAVQRSWQQVLEHVKRESPRIHAFYSPASPTQVAGGALVLTYPVRYATFHAEQAVREENASALRTALQEVLGLAVAIRAEVVGAEAPPEPASDPQPEGGADAVDVEAEGPPEVDQDDAAALLREQLGAEVVDRERH